MKKLLAIILFCILTVGMASVASAEKWQFIASDGEKNSWFFDAHSLKKGTKTTYTVCIKVEFSESEGLEKAGELKLNAPIAYVFNNIEFNFRNNTQRILAFTFYDKNDNPLFSYNSKPSGWFGLAPDSVNEYIFNDTYDYYKKHYK